MLYVSMFFGIFAMIRGKKYFINYDISDLLGTERC